MNEKEKKVLFFVFFFLVLALIFAIGDAMWERGTVRELRWQLEHRDTTKVTEVRIDTIRDTVPKIVSERQVGVIKVVTGAHGVAAQPQPTEKEKDSSEPVVMTPTAIDTIELPKVQRVYTDNSTYKAWVSGYDPRLDSINVYRKTIKETVTISVPTKKKRTFWQRFNIGIQAGYGLGLDDKKAHPYLGGGVGFSF